MKVCAIVPAAGTGSRLKSNSPKVFTKVVDGKTIWDILSEKLLKHVSKVNIVLNSKVEAEYADRIKNEKVFISNQDAPVGMGDAIFQGYQDWKDFDYVLIVWGDQVHVSNSTLEKVLRKTSQNNEYHIVLPVTVQESPYVEYVFDSKLKKLVEIRQSREGDVCQKGGFSDLGVFCLSTNKIKEYWDAYLSQNKFGEKTGEINFLPFLTYLSGNEWVIDTIVVEDPNESRGINTPEDLLFFKELYEKESL